MRWVVGISGASGAIYARRLLAILAEYRRNDDSIQVDVTASNAGRMVYHEEIGRRLSEDVPFKLWAKDDFYAPFASGSAQYDGMVVVPCSGGSLGRIASGASDNLLTRGAEVMLKERRRLILVFRETPLSQVHIDNMATVTRAGGVILPAAPSFYSGATTLEQVVDTVVARILIQMNLPQDLIPEWGQDRRHDE